MDPLTGLISQASGIFEGLAALLFLFGIVLAFFGKKLYDFSNILSGAICGFIFGYLIYAVSGGSAWGILAILFFTIIGAIYAYEKPYAIVAAIAFLPFLFATIYVILESGSIWYGLIPLFLGGIVAGIAVAIFQEYLIFATSLVGGFCVGFSIFISALLGGSDLGAAFIGFIVATIVVCIIGTIFQHAGMSWALNIMGSLLQKIPVLNKILIFIKTRLPISFREKTNLLGITGGILTLISGLISVIGGVIAIFEVPALFFMAILGILGFIFGIGMVKSVVMMNKVESIRRGVTLMFICGILGLITGQGFVIGPILGLASGFLNRKGAKEPKTSNDWTFKAGFFAVKGIPEEALKCAEKALKIDPQNLDAWTLKGAILHDMKKYEDAIYCCNKALEIDSSYEEARKCKSSAEEKLLRELKRGGC